MNDGVFKDIHCPNCKGDTFTALYFYIRNTITIATLQCANPECCSKEIDIVPYDDEHSTANHKCALEIEYHEENEQ